MASLMFQAWNSISFEQAKELYKGGADMRAKLKTFSFNLVRGCHGMITHYEMIRENGVLDDKGFGVNRQLFDDLLSGRVENYDLLKNSEFEAPTGEKLDLFSSVASF